MNDLFIDRAADRVRKTAVALKSRLHPEFFTHFLCQFFKEHRFDSRFHRLAKSVQNPGNETIRDFQLLDFMSVLDENSAKLFQLLAPAFGLGHKSVILT